VRSLGIRGGLQANQLRPTPLAQCQAISPHFRRPHCHQKPWQKPTLVFRLRARTKVVGKSSAVRDGRRLGDDGRRWLSKLKSERRFARKPFTPNLNWVFTCAQLVFAEYLNSNGLLQFALR
jgi:hypothetical protein